MHICSILAALAMAAMFNGSSLAATPSPYAGQEGREIKSLTAAQVSDLLAGKGMGFAKAAELNGYPGPAHVLELASQLRLSQDQVTQTRGLHARMEAEAKEAGAALVTAERELDGLFRSRSATPQLLTQSLSSAAAAQARVREAHLRAHIEQTRLLSPAQVEQYVRLRGYAGSKEHGAPRHGSHKGHE